MVFAAYSANENPATGRVRLRPDGCRAIRQASAPLSNVRFGPLLWSLVAVSPFHRSTTRQWDEVLTEPALGRVRLLDRTGSTYPGGAEAYTNCARSAPCNLNLGPAGAVIDEQGGRDASFKIIR